MSVRICHPMFLQKTKDIFKYKLYLLMLPTRTALSPKLSSNRARSDFIFSFVLNELYEYKLSSQWYQHTCSKYTFANQFARGVINFSFFLCFFVFNCFSTNCPHNVVNTNALSTNSQPNSREAQAIFIFIYPLRVNCPQIF